MKSFYKLAQGFSSQQLLLFTSTFALLLVFRIFKNNCKSTKGDTCKLKEYIEFLKKNPKEPGGHDFSVSKFADTRLLKSVLTDYSSDVMRSGTYRSRSLDIKKQWQEFGISDVEITDHDALLCEPEKVKVVLRLNNLEYKLKTFEDMNNGSSNPNDGIAFHSYSRNGVALDKLCFVHFAKEEDFKRLRMANINFEGKIGLAMYGMISRNCQVDNAARFGMKALILYTDPIIDDHFTTYNGYKEWPDGPARNSSAIERGNVSRLIRFGGDEPTDEAIKRANKIIDFDTEIIDLVSNYSVIARIPSIPISQKDAEVLFSTLGGHGKQFEDWQGLMNCNYWTGPSNATVQIYNQMRYSKKKVYNVVGKIDGVIDEQHVMFGNHRDAWCSGASDPHSGTAIQMNIAKMLGEKIRNGWVPYRPIMLCSWDAGEPGNIGSTLYAIENKEWIVANCLAYINLNDLLRSKITLTGSKSLEQYCKQVLEHFPNLKSNYPIDMEVSKNFLPLQSQVDMMSKSNHIDKVHDFDDELCLKSNQNFKNEKAVIRNIWDTSSDFVVFFYQLGLATLDIKYSKLLYPHHKHSRHDSIDWFETFGDPNYKFTTEATDFIGTLLLKLSCCPILEMNLQSYGHDLQSGLEEIERQFPNHKFQELKDQVAIFKTNALLVEQLIDNLKNSKTSSKWLRQVINLNKKLKELDQHLIDKTSEIWYRHILYMPDFKTGASQMKLSKLMWSLEEELSVQETKMNLLISLKNLVKFTSNILENNNFT